MKRFCFLAIAMALGITAAAQADDPPAIPRAPLASGANLGQLSNLGLPTTGGSPFSNGLGQIVSGWTQQGIHGQELADRVHWLQSMRADEIAQRTRWLDQRRFDQSNGFRDIREDRREIREDERRLARDREDLRRDLRDRDDRFRDRDIREDRREIRDDERRLARDREDLRRDLNDRNREDRVRDRNHEDNGLHRGWRITRTTVCTEAGIRIGMMAAGIATATTAACATTIHAATGMIAAATATLPKKATGTIGT
jgi:hypothetical protein